MKMKQIKANAKLRRARFLAQLSKFDTQTDMAEFHGVSRAYISKIIAQAKKEAEVIK